MHSFYRRSVGLKIYTIVACLVGLMADGCSSNTSSNTGGQTQSPTVTAAMPTFTPADGMTFASALSISLADSTSGATIYYTTDGTTPATSSSVYSGTFTIKTTTTVKAMATASGASQSQVATATYTAIPAAAAPTFTPATGTTFPATLSVTLNDTTPNATIYYTTNGTTPTTSSSVYSGPITINATTTIEAMTTAASYTQSAVSSATYTYTPAMSDLVSDNFDEPSLNTSLWKLENPLGDGTVSMSGSGVTLNVPRGSNHDLWTSGNNAVRIVQPVANGDFSVDARFQSAVEIGNQDEGILVEQDGSDFLRFDIEYQSSIGPVLFAAGINGANPTTFFSTPISLPKGPVVLRLARSGNAWTASWSTDGTNFTVAGNFTFGLNVAAVGPYAGSSNVTAADTPAFTATVDYFFNTANPIANQDGPKPYGYVTIDPAPAGVLVEKTLADVEGTGHLEPVIGLEANADGSGGGIYWYSYPASGNVNDTWIKNTIASSGYAYEDMLAYDVNGDGAVDIVASFDATLSGTYDIVWFENPRGKGGNPATDPWVIHTVGPGLGENNLQIADIDGDGKMDIITASSIFFQDSPTSWTQLQYSTSFRGVALLDIGTGKGSINLVGTQPVSPYNLIWWENPRETGGNARTGTWLMHTIGPGYPCGASDCSDGGSVAVFESTDVNGDGIQDIISAQSDGATMNSPGPPGGVIWWQAPLDRRNGTWIQHTIDANMVDVHKIAIGDMDKNGTPDIVVAEQDQAPLQRVNIYYNDGEGNLTPQVIANATGHNVCLGNVIGNKGELDILNSGHGYYGGSHPLQIFLNPY